MTFLHLCLLHVVNSKAFDYHHFYILLFHTCIVLSPYPVHHLHPQLYNIFVSPQPLFMYTTNPCMDIVFLAFLSPYIITSLTFNLLSYFPTLFHFTPLSNVYHLHPPLSSHPAMLLSGLFYFFPPLKWMSSSQTPPCWHTLTEALKTVL